MMALEGRTHMQCRMRQVLDLSAQRDGAPGAIFSWACALHTGSYETEVEELGKRVVKTYECWALTTLGGETLTLTAEMVTALDREDTACWWMGAHPVMLERTPMFVAGEPLKTLFATHMEGPDPLQLGLCSLDFRSLIRPADFSQSIILACTHRPPGLPR